jgi:hypothetical protein
MHEAAKAFPVWSPAQIGGGVEAAADAFAKAPRIRRPSVTS